MKIEPWSEQLATLVRTLQRSASRAPGWEKAAAERFHALPVYSDASATLLLSASGELLQIADADDAACPLEDPLWARIARASAVRRYPELQGLLPPRQASALDCRTCAGKGSVANVLCGVCGGYGWLEPLVT